MQKKISIFYTSDVHGHLHELASCMGSFSHDGNSLIFDGGDLLQGSTLTAYLKERDGSPVGLCAEMLNLGGYSAITLGNHDFDYGPRALEKYISSLDAVCLCANVDGIAGVRKTCIFTLENGLRIGVTGVTNGFVPVYEKPENLIGVTIANPVDAAACALESLRAKETDINICIYHGGFENDPFSGRALSFTGEDRAYEMCSSLGFDILLTGHRHVPLSGIHLNSCFACQPPCNGEGFVKIDLTVDETVERKIENSIVYSGREIGPREKAVLSAPESEAELWLDKPVGRIDEFLDTSDRLNMALEGSLLANLFNSVQLEASGADVSCTSIANDAKGISRNVTVRDIISSYIFSNSLVTLKVNRQVLKSALERCAEYYSLTEAGRIEISDKFLSPEIQHYNYDFFSGIDYTFDISRPPGDRVISIRFRGSELDDVESLSLCMNSYRATGAGGYDIYKTCPVISMQGGDVIQLIIDYIQSHNPVTVDTKNYISIV